MPGPFFFSPEQSETYLNRSSVLKGVFPMIKANQLEENYVLLAAKLAAELRESLPKEFTLGCRLRENGRPMFPNLVFIADSEIPGLYSAEVDPDIIMGRRSSREVTSPSRSPLVSLQRPTESD
jgi:hypothetical protein